MELMLTVDLKPLPTRLCLCQPRGVQRATQATAPQYADEARRASVLLMEDV